MPYRPGIDNDVWHSRIDQMKQAWNAYLAAAQQTRDDIRALSGPFARLP